MQASLLFTFGYSRFAIIVRCLLLCLLFPVVTPIQAEQPAFVRITSIQWQEEVDLVEYGIRLPDLTARLEKELIKRDYRLTPSDIFDLADQATLFFREQGLQFASVYLPEQKLANGVLQLGVLPGYLGDIQVTGQTRPVVADTIKEYFSEWLNKPVFQPALERSLQTLEADPRIDVFGFYSRGAEPGEVRLNLKLKRYAHWASQMRVDNYGSPHSGEYRGIVQVSYLNLLNRMDTLDVSGMHTFGEQQDEQNVFGSLRYAIPVMNHDTRLRVSFSNNRFDVGDQFQQLAIRGKGRFADMGLEHSWACKPSLQAACWQAVVGLQGFRRQADYESDLGEPLLSQNEKLRGGALLFAWERDLPAHRGSFGMNYRYEAGSANVRDYRRSHRVFRSHHLGLQFDWLGFSSHPLATLASLSLRGQHANDTLPALQQAAFSGAYGLRAVEAGYLGVDRFGLGRLEIRWPYSLARFFSGQGFMRPLLVWEYAYGEQLVQKQVAERTKGRGAGLGLEFGWGKRLSGRVLALDLIGLDSLSNRPVPEQHLFSELSVRF